MEIASSFTSVRYFGSNQIVPENVGSNFHAAELTVGPDELAAYPALARYQPLLADGLTRTFASSEHLGQCRKAADTASLEAFTTSVRTLSLSLRSVTFLLTLPLFHVLRLRVAPHVRSQGIAGLLTQAFFERIGLTEAKAAGKVKHWIRKLNVGAVAKMAANRKHARRLRLNMRFVEGDEPGYEQETHDWWLAVVSLKAAQNAEFRAWLMSAPAAVYLCEYDLKALKHPEAVFWGGQVETRLLYGRNIMGQILMDVRAARRELNIYNLLPEERAGRGQERRRG
jgi:hypothetical protein